MLFLSDGVLVTFVVFKDVFLDGLGVVIERGVDHVSMEAAFHEAVASQLTGATTCTREDVVLRASDGVSLLFIIN